MSDKPPHVVLVTNDAELRSLVTRHRPPAARLRCVRPNQLPRPDTRSPAQLWLDLDAAERERLPDAPRRVFFYSSPKTPASTADGLFIRKPCAATVVDVLWAGVDFSDRAPAEAEQHAKSGGLPAWLPEFQELSLEEVCRKCVSQLPGRLGLADVSLYLYNTAANLLTLAESNHRREIDLAVPCTPTPASLMCAVAQGRSVLFTDDAARAFADLGLPAPRRPERYADPACLVAPLYGGTQLVGVLNFSRPTATRGRARTLPLQGVFDFLGRCLHHARLFEQARNEARIDGLTGLFNYRWVRDTLAKEINRARRFDGTLSLVMIDLDGLKTINDRDGHLAGDALLRHVAQKITGALRQFDSAARVGGDEFLVLLPATALNGAQLVARRILSAIRDDPPLFRNAPLHVTASLGAAQWQPAWGPDRLTEAADRALYTAKTQGRDRIVFHGPEAALSSPPAPPFSGPRIESPPAFPRPAS